MEYFWYIEPVTKGPDVFTDTMNEKKKTNLEMKYALTASDITQFFPSSIMTPKCYPAK